MPIPPLATSLHDRDADLLAWQQALDLLRPLVGDPSAPAPGLMPPPDTGADATPWAIGADLTEPVDLVASAASTTAATASTAPVLSSYSTGRGAGLYNIEIKFQGSWTADLQQAFIHAAQVIESIIHDDVPNVLVRTAAGIVAVDDISITATLKGIDGVGGVLGQTGPTAIRTGSYIPAMADMTFDTADARALQATPESMTSGGRTYAETLWDATVEHEMLHALGFGTLWGLKHLVSGNAYVGSAGDLAYARMLHPGATAGVAVPLETTGGSGTAGAHWSEAVFGKELMTGYLNKAYAPLSAMSAYALADLGYGLDTPANWKIDPYALV